ncbi:MAG: MarR family transcriptional regulator [Clostridia bacterium]|nr:MarR family transcriptional regulator [Clostridia bacterium]
MIKFMKNINLVSRSAEQYREERLSPFGIKGCQSHYFLEICRTPGVSQEELSRRLFVNKSNVARQISLLEEGGFVKREAKEGDKRTFLLYPTQKMLDALPEVKRVHGEWRELVTEGFTEEESEQLKYLSEKMVENVRKYMENRQ